MTGMDFGEVIRALKADPSKRFTREGWNGKGQYISLEVPGPTDRMDRSFVYIHTNYGANVPWLASQTDMLAEDWREARWNGRIE